MSVQFIQPATLEELLQAIAEQQDQAHLIAGGTRLTLLLRNKLIAPQMLISLAKVPGLDRIEVQGDDLHIGPMASIESIGRSALVREFTPALAQACSKVGNIRVRNQGTLGGNLAEADYASDPPAALVAFDASVTATSAEGTRSIPVSELCEGFFTTSLAPAEIITAIRIPVARRKVISTYTRYSSRSSEDRPCVCVAVWAEMESATCSQLRVVVGAASEIPVRLPEVEALAQDEALSDSLISKIAEGYAQQVESLDDLRGSAWYRRRMIAVHVRRALEEVRDNHR